MREGIPLWVHNQRWGLDCHFWRFKIFAWHNCSFRLIDKFLESWQVFLWPLSIKRRVLLCLDLIFKCKLLKFQFVSFYKFLDLVKSSETFRSEVLKLFDCFPDETFFEETINKFLVVFFALESREDLTLINNFPLFFRIFSFIPLNIFQIKKPSLNNKFLPSDPLIQSCSVQFKNVFFKFDVLRSIIIVKLHICKKQLCIHIVLLVKVTSLWLIPKNILATRLCCVTSTLLSIFTWSLLTTINIFRQRTQTLVVVQIFELSGLRLTKLILWLLKCFNLMFHSVLDLFVYFVF